MSPKGPLAHLRTELGFELHRLPIGEFEALERPEDVLELAADGIIEHFEEEGAGRPTEAGPAALSGGRAVVFICREQPRYAVHTLLAPSADRPRWRAWVDRYETWNVLVRDHPEFAPRDLRGARASPRRTPPHEVLEELEVQMVAEDASASFM